MTLYFECRINKNALPRLFFWRFCQLGTYLYLSDLKKYSKEIKKKCSVLIMFLERVKSPLYYWTS